MDTNQLEKQLQIWNRFMYMLLGSSITLVITCVGYLFYSEWFGFDNYVGGIWTWIQLLATPPGFYLLLSKRWRLVPLSTRANTIFGYFLASWFSLLAFGVITANNAPVELNFLIACTAMLIALGYIWALKRTSNPRDEMFP